MVNCYAWYTRYPNAEEHPPSSPPSKGECGSAALGEQANAFGVRPWASGGEPTEQRAGRNKIRLSERSELPDFPACKRREGV